MTDNLPDVTGAQQEQRDLTTHERQSKRTRDKYATQDDVEDALKAAARAIEVGTEHAFGDAVVILHEEAIPALRQVTKRPLAAYTRELTEDTIYGTVDHYRAVGRQPVSVIQQLAGAQAGVAVEADGYDDPRRSARAAIIGALAWLEAVAREESIVQDSYDRRVPADGFRLQLGAHLQDGEMDLGDRVEAVSLQAGTLKTLFCGQTGFGKSTGLEREAEDFYRASLDPDYPDYKLLDLVDLESGENWYPDIPQQQSKLRTIRERDFDLAPDFAAADDLADPSVQILVPLTPGLATTQLPYSVNDDRFRVQPFTIPASELRKEVLVPTIMSRLSSQQENTIRQAYDDVNRRVSDWRLADLADEIRTRDELDPKHKADAIGVLRSLQDVGFVRDKSSQYTLDWYDIFQSTDTVTLFSQAFVNRRVGKLFCLAALVDRILQLRAQWTGLPDAVALMRELWEVTPHKQRTAADERAAALQGVLGTRMTRALRKNRHYDLHVLADTQEPNDLNIAVRERFNRYVAYSATSRAVEKMFGWTMNEREYSFASTLNQKEGQAGVVGQVKPAIENRKIEFISPMEYAPPAHHHHDRKRDDTGWHTRVKHLTPAGSCPECGYSPNDEEQEDVDDEDEAGSEPLDHRDDGRRVYCPACDDTHIDPSLGREEVLREPVDIDGVDWPDRLDEEYDIAEARGSSDAPDPEMSPVAAFVHHNLEEADIGSWIHTTTLRAVFNEYLTGQGREPWQFAEHSRKVKFGDRLNSTLDSLTKCKRDGEQALAGVGWTQQGRQLLEATTTGSDAAAAGDD
jgi:hypothetical protein